MKNGELEARRRLENNGRNAANKNAGIRVGSDLHLCEMLLADIDRLRAALRNIAAYSPASTVQPVALARDALFADGSGD